MSNKTSSQVTDDIPVAISSSQQNVLSAAKGSSILFLGTLFQYILRFALGFVLARLLGATQYGLYSLADSMMAVAVGVALLGMDTALVYFIPRYAGRDDGKSLRETAQIGLGIPLVIGVIVGVVLFVFADWIAVVIFGEPDLAPLLKIIAFVIPFGTLMAAILAVTKGFTQMHYKVIAEDIGLSSLKLAFTLLLALTGLTAVKAMTAYSAATIGACILLIYFLHRLIPLKQLLGLNRNQLSKMMRFSFPLYLSRLLEIFGPNLKTILLGMLNTVASVGIYTVALRTRLVGMAFHNSVVVMAMPIVSDLYGQKQFKDLGRFYRTMTKWTFTFNLPLFLIIVFFPEELLSIFGTSFVAGATALIILAMGDLVNAATGICGVMITMTGNTWLNTINSVLSFSLVLLLNILFIYQYGLVGAAIATTAGIILINFVRLVEVYILFRMLPYDGSFIKPIIAGIAAAGVTWVLMNMFLIGGGWLGTIVGIGVLSVTFVLTILMLGLSEEDKMILNRVRGRLSRSARPKMGAK